MFEKIIKKINASPYMAYLAIAGGGTSFIGDFLLQSGGSKTLLGAFIPYSQDLLTEFIGAEPEKYVSADTARKMAMASYRIASDAVGHDKAIGIGATAAIRTDGEREGRKHRFNVCVHTKDLCLTINAEFDKNLSRSMQEDTVVNTILFALERGCGLSGQAEKLIEGVSYQKAQYDVSNREGVVKLFTEGEWLVNSDEAECLISQDRVVVFAGSFNPLHEGHMKMYEMAKTLTGIAPVFEVAVSNVDKPDLSYHDIMSRLSQFQKHPLIMTKDPLFTGKFTTIRDANPLELGKNKRIDFIVGLDTWKRIVSEKYSVGDEVRNHVGYLKNVGFIIFNRGNEDFSEDMGNFQNVVFVKGFDEPISSTQIRKNSK